MARETSITENPFRSISISELAPGITDDGMSSHSSGPLVVMRHPDGSLVVEDGNHEYFERIREDPGQMVNIVEIPYVPYEKRDDEGRYLGNYRKQRE